MRADALRLLQAPAAEVVAAPDALASAHIAFVRPHECIAVRRDHVEGVLRRMEADPGAVLDLGVLESRKAGRCGVGCRPNPDVTPAPQRCDHGATVEAVWRWRRFSALV